LIVAINRGFESPARKIFGRPWSFDHAGPSGLSPVVPVRVAFLLRNGVGAQGMNLYEAQWLAYALPYRRFAVVLTDCVARLGADTDRYFFVVSDLHRLLVTGLPAHCERFWTLPVLLEVHRSMRKARCVRVVTAISPCPNLPSPRAVAAAAAGFFILRGSGARPERKP
jgi:hypothetical protein